MYIYIYIYDSFYICLHIGSHIHIICLYIWSYTYLYILSDCWLLQTEDISQRFAASRAFLRFTPLQNKYLSAVHDKVRWIHACMVGALAWSDGRRYHCRERYATWCFLASLECLAVRCFCLCLEYIYIYVDVFKCILSYLIDLLNYLYSYQ